MNVSDPIAWLLVAPAMVYTLGIVAIALWRRKAEARSRRVASDDLLPPVAILVAARNEAGNIARCLDALLAQDYPADRVTIYVADDHSTDATPAILADYAGRLRDEGGARLRLISVPDSDGPARGKALAIHTAIEASTEELLLMTDADCAPPPSWVRAMVEYFDDPSTGVVTAATTVDPASADRPLFGKVQALDWRYLLTASAFMVETGRPITAMGNNMAFRRAAYDAVGGYPALPFSVTEDYLLFRRIVDETPYRARFPVDGRLLNVTRALRRPDEVFGQRRRWARGGLRAPAIAYGIYGLTHLALLLPLVALFLAPLLAAGTMAARVGADLLLLRAATHRADRGQLGAFPVWEVYFTAYMCVLPASVLLFPRIRWKGRRL